MSQVLLPVSTWLNPITPPLLTVHSPRIQALIRRLRTPVQVQRWLLTLRYNKKETLRSIHGVTHHHHAHCLEAALTAAAILEHHGPAPHQRNSATTGAGYPPLILDLESADKLDHTLFLFRQRGKYGTVGFSRDIGLNGRKPVYKTIRTLVQSYAAPYIDKKACITGYGVLDLRTIPENHWRTSKRHVWFVEEALRQIPHRPLKLSANFIRTWRRRYLNFNKKYPHSQPDYFPNQRRWI